MSYSTRYEFDMYHKGYKNPRNVTVKRCSHEYVEGAIFCHVCGAKTHPINLIDKIILFIESYQNKPHFLFGGIPSCPGETGEKTRWADMDGDMKMLTDEFKNVTFSITGYGDEESDVWRKYFRHGYEPQNVTVELVFGPNPFLD